MEPHTQLRLGNGAGIGRNETNAMNPSFNDDRGPHLVIDTRNQEDLDLVLISSYLASFAQCCCDKPLHGNVPMDGVRTVSSAIVASP